MTARIFVDTNVLVYAVDRSEPVRRSHANAVIDALGPTQSGAVSAQVIGEFVSAAGNRIAAPLAPHEVDSVVTSAHATFALIPLDAAVIREALRCRRRYSVSYWDAQIWAAARIGGIDIIVSEDCPALELEGIRYVNPFAEGFDLAALVAGGPI